MSQATNQAIRHRRRRRRHRHPHHRPARPVDERHHAGAAPPSWLLPWTGSPATPAIKAAIITSGKPAFIAGADLMDIVNIYGSGVSGPELMREISRYSAVLRKLETSGKPVAAAINGTALGGGLELCLACHFRVLEQRPEGRRRPAGSAGRPAAGRRRHAAPAAADRHPAGAGADDPGHARGAREGEGARHRARAGAGRRVAERGATLAARKPRTPCSPGTRRASAGPAAPAPCTRAPSRPSRPAPR